MAFVVVFAGGTGVRMDSSNIPKQFIEVDGKPIIIRTLENFTDHPDVDGIVIACLSDWIDELQKMIAEFRIQKVLDVVPGGKTGFESIRNGLLRVAKIASPSDIVLICDGVRPLVSQKLITDCIEYAKRYTSAVPVTPSIDSVLLSQDGLNCDRNIPRGITYITQAPQGYTLELIMWAHEEAERRGLHNPISSADLLIELGKAVHIFTGNKENIKVTTPEDLLTLRSWYYYDRYRKFAEEERQYDI